MRSNHAKLRQLRTWFVGLAMLSGCLGVSPAVLAVPITLLDISGAGNVGQYVDLGQAVAVSFSLDQSYTDVAISAPILCVECTGEIFLMKGGIGGPDADQYFMTAAYFDINSPYGGPLFSGLTLDAGYYFLMMANVGSSGGIGWTGSDPATIFTATGVKLWPEIFADPIVPDVPYRSDFYTVFETRALHFTVTAAPAEDSGDGSGEGTGAVTVPEPSGLSLMLLGGLLVAWFSRAHPAGQLIPAPIRNPSQRDGLPLA